MLYGSRAQLNLQPSGCAGAGGGAAGGISGGGGDGGSGSSSGLTLRPILPRPPSGYAAFPMAGGAILPPASVNLNLDPGVFIYPPLTRPSSSSQADPMHSHCHALSRSLQQPGGEIGCNNYVQKETIPTTTTQVIPTSNMVEELSFYGAGTTEINMGLDQDGFSAAIRHDNIVQQQQVQPIINDKVEPMSPAMWDDYTATPTANATSSLWDDLVDPFLFDL